MPLMLSPTPEPSTTNSSSSPHTIPPQIRIKNRRKLYLDRNPSYFTSPDLELLDPLLYDRCIRKFQTPAEREADGRQKGYSGVLEADLYRSEAKLAAVRESTSHQAHRSHPSYPSSSSSNSSPSNPSQPPSSSSHPSNPPTYEPPLDPEDPQTKAEGLERWKSEMTLRFLKGGDPDFEYGPVDESDEYDVIERTEEEEKWFEDEEARFVGEDEKMGEGPGGETGVQDF